MDTIPKAVPYIANHILEYFSRPTHSSPPLFVAFQGPQGSGKSFLTSCLKAYLSETPLHLKVAVLSIDDLYLPHPDLRALAEEHRENRLWSGRGQPGTHDVKLGVQILEQLKKVNDSERVGSVELPVFDKSMHGGEGDRLPPGSGPTVRQPLDIVLFEGWCTGFFPISGQELHNRWVNDWTQTKKNLNMADDGVCSKEDVKMVNEALRQYVTLWDFFDIFVQIKPATTVSDSAASPYSIIYKWRLQQEHAMKASNGGRGMSDEAVKIFVDRYIPGYVFFGDGIIRGGNEEEDGGTRTKPPWIGKGLCLCIGESRDVVSIEKF